MMSLQNTAHNEDSAERIITKGRFPYAPVCLITKLIINRLISTAFHDTNDGNDGIFLIMRK